MVNDGIITDLAGAFIETSHSDGMRVISDSCCHRRNEIRRVRRDTLRNVPSETIRCRQRGNDTCASVRLSRRRQGLRSSRGCHLASRSAGCSPCRLRQRRSRCHRRSRSSRRSATSTTSSKRSSKRRQISSNRANDVKAEQIADVQQVQSELQQQQSDLKVQQEQQQQTLDETQKKVDEAEKKQDEAEKLVNSLEAKAAAEARAAMSASLREATESKSTNNSSSSSINTSVGNSSVTEYAKRFIGVPYVYGGSTPSGFDCSGFVNYVYSAFGLKTGGRSTYSIASYLRSSGKAKYSLSELVPGDMVMTSAGHVGIYLGSGMMVHSPRPGRTVCIQSVYSFYLGGGL